MNYPAKPVSRLLLVALMTMATANAHAVLNDPPYFNIWTKGQVDAANLTGDGSAVLLCGTSSCGATATTSDQNYAIFHALDKNTAKGSGNINPFLRFDQNIEGSGGSNGTEAAFNTDFRTKTTGQQIGELGTVTSLNPSSVIGNQAKDSGAGGSPGFNHAVQFNTLIADTNGYYHFMLDINEPGQAKATLRLDELAFFTSASNTLNKFVRDDPNTATADSHFADATASKKIWDMDFNKVGPNGTSYANSSGSGRIGGLIMDSEINQTNGSGDFDMEVLLNKNLFAGVAGTDYVYLYNLAGAADVADGTVAEAGFEEWAFDSNPDTVRLPEPNTLVLFLAAALVGTISYRRQSLLSRQ